jgi:hypothetical protein
MGVDLQDAAEVGEVGRWPRALGVRVVELGHRRRRGSCPGRSSTA